MGYRFYEDHSCKRCGQFTDTFCDSCGCGVCTAHHNFVEITPNKGVDACDYCLKVFGPTGKIGNFLLNAGKVRRY